MKRSHRTIGVVLVVGAMCLLLIGVPLFLIQDARSSTKEWREACLERFVKDLRDAKTSGRLELYNARFATECFRHLDGVAEIECMYVIDSDVRAALDPLATMPNLRLLILSQNAIEPSDITSVANAPNLRSLALIRCTLLPNTIINIGESSTIRRLALDLPLDVLPAGPFRMSLVQAIGRMKELEILMLGGFSTGEMKTIQQALPDIETIDITDWELLEIEQGLAAEE